MKKMLLLPILALALVTTSCKSTLAGTISTPISVGENIRPLDADVTVDVTKKIEGESNSLYFLIFRLSGDKKYAEGVDYSAKSGLFSSKVARAKSAAAYKAVIDSKSDLIVHPNYVVDIENWVFFKRIHVKVNGYAGTINKIYQHDHCDHCSPNYKGDFIAR
jgi:hypothetical protein